MFRLQRHGSRRPSKAGLWQPAEKLSSSATDVEMAQQPRRRLFADGLHRAEDGDSNVPLLNDKINSAEGVEYSHLPIAGSIYRVIAFGTPNRTRCDALFQQFAYYLAFVQMLAPPMMLWYALRHIDWSKSRVTFVASEVYREENGVEKVLIMTLGYMFLVPFLANLAIFCKKNTEDYVRLHAVSVYLAAQGDFWVCTCALTCGCMLHCLITPMIMIVTWYLTATSSSPIDITMNMLGLTFVVGMDQLAADFADTLGYYDWDDQKTGDFVYQTLKDKSVPGDEAHCIANPDDPSEYPTPWWCCFSNVVNWCMMVTILMVFSFYKVEEFDSDDKKELAALRAIVADLQSKLDNSQ